MCFCSRRFLLTSWKGIDGYGVPFVSKLFCVSGEKERQYQLNFNKIGAIFRQKMNRFFGKFGAICGQKIDSIFWQNRRNIRAENRVDFRVEQDRDVSGCGSY